MNSTSKLAARSALSPWRLWLGWTIATTLAWGVGAPVGVLAAGSAGLITVTLAAYALGALLAGSLQSVFLAGTLTVRSWILASVTGVALMAGLAFALAMIETELGLLGVTLLGPTLGILQWRLLRKKLRKAWCWILASVLGWIAGGLAIAMEGLNMDANPSSPPGWMVLGAINGAITGLTLALLLRRASRTASHENESTRMEG